MSDAEPDAAELDRMVRTAGPQTLKALATISDDAVLAMVEVIASTPRPSANTADGRAARLLISRFLGLRDRARRLKGGRAAAATRRAQSQEEMRAIDALRTKNPRLSWVAAARLHLQTIDHTTWLSASNEEQRTRTESLARKMRNARRSSRNTGHT